MITGQVLFHRFYCKKSLARFHLKMVAATCVWLASKLEESPREARQVLIVFHRMECRRENLPIEHLDINSEKYLKLKLDLMRTERKLLKELNFILHVIHPHKLLSIYLDILEIPLELRQEAWNLANDSLRTLLCIRFRSEVIACGILYTTAIRFGVPLPENPPWWKAFDADKADVSEVHRVLTCLYSRPTAKYLPVEAVFFTSSAKTWDSQTTVLPKEGSLNMIVASGDTSATKMIPSAANVEYRASKNANVRQALGKLKESKKSNAESKDMKTVRMGRQDFMVKSKRELRTGRRNLDRKRKLDDS